MKFENLTLTQHFKVGILSFLFFYGILIFSLDVNAQPVSRTYGDDEPAGTYQYNIPAGYTATLTVQAWGGGGAGGPSTTGNKGGGGGGAYASTTFINVPSGNYTLVVGTGGTAGNPSTSGNSSSFTYSTNVIAVGGSVGGNTQGGSGGQDISCTGTVRISGSNGAAPSGSQDGGSGGGGANMGGAGGGGGSGSNTPGSPGTAPGGGGGGKGGAGNGVNSGNGGIGRVIVTVVGFLPVELISFTGETRDNTIILNWATATEINNKGFHIKRMSANTNGASDKANWKTLDFVSGHGNSFEVQQYSFVDKNPQPGVNYYILEQEDYDGATEKSPVVSVRMERDVTDLQFVPNPAHRAEVNMRLSGNQKGDGLLEIYDWTGKLSHRQNLGELDGLRNLPLQLAELPSGTYVARLTVEGKVQVQKLIIQ
jgi:hypothetical protein